ncbi:MAG: glutamate racemase [Cytophagales bacterium]|nr:MAG: glutamate racemase [Cytophagales bacterium]
MQTDYTSNPIGIFDSGIGGLTVARAVAECLPEENLIYFGDTAHLPYGDKSTTSIQAYSIKICNFLLTQNCKVILIACNSASAAAYELVKEYVGSKATVISVIEPTIQYIEQYHQQHHIGLIGTKQTVNSNVYKKKIDQLNQNITLQSLATPLLVPMIEENFFSKTIQQEIISEYLSHQSLEAIDALILGCTHYPLIKEEIKQYYQTHKKTVQIIDSSERVAQTLKKTLEDKKITNINNQTTAKTGFRNFYVSDYTQSFEESAKIFFGQQIHLALYPLWD